MPRRKTDRISLSLLPLLVALAGIGGILIVQQQRHTQALQLARIESDAAIAEADRELRLLGIFARMITSGDPVERERGLALMRVFDAELVERLSQASSDFEGNAAPVGNQPAGRANGYGAAGDVPPVYIHIRREADRSEATTVANALSVSGYRIAAIEHISDRGPAQSQVRYFQTGTKDGAGEILRLVEGVGITAELAYIPGFEESASRPHHYEIWLAPRPEGGR